jgi:glycosyltransferase involved in cell wall biosynthesis
MHSKNISIAVIVKNEEDKISSFIDAHIDYANILVADDQSSDHTVTLALQHGAHIFPFVYDGYFSRRNLKEIFDKATTDWVIVAGIGIRIPAKAFDKIEHIIKQHTDIRGINLFRQSYSNGYPTHSSKLWYQFDHRDTTSCMCINKQHWNENLSKIHCEFPIMGTKDNIVLLPPTAEFTVKHLRNILCADNQDKHNRYSTAEASQRYSDGERCGILKAIILPLKIFLIMLVLSPKNKISILATIQHFHYELQVYLKLVELSLGLSDENFKKETHLSVE